MTVLDGNITNVFVERVHAGILIDTALLVHLAEMHIALTCKSVAKSELVANEPAAKVVDRTIVRGRASIALRNRFVVDHGLKGSRLD